MRSAASAPPPWWPTWRRRARAAAAAAESQRGLDATAAHLGLGRAAHARPLDAAMRTRTPTARACASTFATGGPAIDEFPLDIWRRLLAANAKRPARDSLGYAPPAGHASMREALAEYLNRARGLHCDAEQIVIVNGSQQGIDLATARVARPRRRRGRSRSRTTPGATVPIEAIGARLIRVATDAQGARHRTVAASSQRAAWPT